MCVCVYVFVCVNVCVCVSVCRCHNFVSSFQISYVSVSFVTVSLARCLLRDTRHLDTFSCINPSMETPCTLHLHVVAKHTYTYTVVIPLAPFPLHIYIAYMQDVVQTLRSWAIVVISTYRRVFLCYCSYHCMATVSYDRQPDGNSFIQATFLRFARNLIA